MAGVFPEECFGNTRPIIRGEREEWDAGDGEHVHGGERQRQDDEATTEGGRGSGQTRVQRQVVGMATIGPHNIDCVH